MLEHFQKRLESIVSSHGLTEGDVKDLTRGLRLHRLISSQLWQAAGKELALLLPDQRSDYEWDEPLGLSGLCW